MDAFTFLCLVVLAFAISALMASSLLLIAVIFQLISSYRERKKQNPPHHLS